MAVDGPEPDRQLVARIEKQAIRDGWSKRGALAHAVLASKPHPSIERRARAIIADERANR